MARRSFTRIEGRRWGENWAGWSLAEDDGKPGARPVPRGQRRRGVAIRARCHVMLPAAIRAGPHPLKNVELLTAGAFPERPDRCCMGARRAANLRSPQRLASGSLTEQLRPFLEQARLLQSGEALHGRE